MARTDWRLVKATNYVAPDGGRQEVVIEESGDNHGLVKVTLVRNGEKVSHAFDMDRLLEKKLRRARR